MYVTFNKESKRVAYVGNVKPVNYSDNLTLAEVSEVPSKYDYLLAINEREESEILKNIELIDDMEVEVENVRNYIKVDLLAQFKPLTIKEQMEKDAILNNSL